MVKISLTDKIAKQLIEKEFIKDEELPEGHDKKLYFFMDLNKDAYDQAIILKEEHIRNYRKEKARQYYNEKPNVKQKNLFYNKLAYHIAKIKELEKDNNIDTVNSVLKQEEAKKITSD